MKTPVAIPVLIALFWTSTASAEWGAAGCGLGYMLSGSEGNQIIAATTNLSFGSQVFGITSGTSGCDAATGARGKKAEIFIDANRDVLAKEISRGGGETLTHLAALMECRDADRFGSALQKRYAHLFTMPRPSTESLHQGIKRVLADDGSLDCQPLPN